MSPPDSVPAGEVAYHRDGAGRLAGMWVEERLGVKKVGLCFGLVLRAPQRGGFP
ncbi:MAG: hypothetical protein AVDCRST_MAG28-3194 [uncultured Rubrobacteraceae bacterium]|uniref:Uncharacterized protein n=1 Tax=uncultured Rubrobacteraceae bacterium TaxID=349277 RepID=A0A6J4R1Z4_9ACTN|nr:MAG: hypothetical protein AVDCRST_MAG28-3194 [uncultured Rubrobacteraceae bacterium]